MFILGFIYIFTAFNLIYDNVFWKRYFRVYFSCRMICCITLSLTKNYLQSTLLFLGVILR